MANFTQQGSARLLTIIGDGATVAADTLYVGLATAAPGNTTTLATVTEHTTVGGYARKQVTSANWAVDAAGVATTGTAVRWGTGITLTAATHWFLCDAASGTVGNLFCYNALGGTRNLATADTLDVDVTDIHIS